MVVSSRAILRDQAGVKLVRIARLANRSVRFPFGSHHIATAVSA